MDAKGQMSGWLSGQHGSRQGLSWEVAGSTGVPVLGGGEAQVMAARLLRCLISPQLWVTRNV